MLRWSGQVWSDEVQTWGNLPSGFQPKSVAAGATSAEAWVAGNTGIYHTTDYGESWAQQYSGGTNKVAVKNGVGWAITASGGIRKYDGSAWPLDATAPSVGAGADLAVHDATYLAIANGGTSFFTLSGTTWTTNSSGSVSQASVAWAGGDNVIAAKAGTSVIRVGTGSPGSFQWSDSWTTPSYDWKLRYLVCRMEAYADPIDPATGIPADVRGIIDRSVAASVAGPSALQDAEFVLDDWSGRAGFQVLDGTLEQLGVSVYREEDGAKYTTHRTNVIGYSSNGCYDPAGNSFTTWWRPMNSWKDGAIGMFYAVSGDLHYPAIRDPEYFWRVQRDPNAANVEPNTLKVYLWPTLSGLYTTHWIGLHAADGTLLTHANGQPAAGYFDQMQTLSPVFAPETQDTFYVAKIDLSTVTFPGGNTYVAVHFPHDDPLHWGAESDRSTPSSLIQANASGGITFAFERGQSLAAGLIREGCSGVAGNIIEPYSPYVPNPQVILPQYAVGRTWAESAYMGLPTLSWMETVIGDPLMAAYAEPPQVTITAPSTNGSVVSGVVSIAAQAVPDGTATGISRMEVWVASGHEAGDPTPISERLATVDNSSSVSYAFDTTVQSGGGDKYPNGVYFISVVAYDNSVMKACGTATRAITIGNGGGSQVTAVITAPATDGEHVCGPMTVEATTSDPGSVQAVEFWVLDPNGPVLVGTDSTASGSAYSCSFHSGRFVDGNHSGQGVVKCNDGKVAVTSVRSFVVVNRPGVEIVNPNADMALKTAQFDVVAQVDAEDSSVVDSVEFLICGPQTPIETLATDSAAPYTCAVDPSDYPVGQYVIRAVPRRTGGIPLASYADRKVLLASGYTSASGIGALFSMPDVSHVALENTVVSAYGQSSLSSAFYIANPDGSAGMRVTADPEIPLLSPGDGIVLLGTMDTSAEGEREIVPDTVICRGAQPARKPVAMAIRSLGGASPHANTNGVDDVYGLYNVGQLVRVCGRVNYVGGDFVYVDDGSGGTDGSGLLYYPVPIDGSDIPDDGIEVTGVRCYFGSATKPKIGDYVGITGISSIKLLNGHHARYLRATTQADQLGPTYQSCYVWSGPGYVGFFANANNTQQYHVGDTVRLATDDVYANYGDYFIAWCEAHNRPGVSYGLEFWAETTLTASYTDLVVLGTITCDNDLIALALQPDAIYHGAVGSAGIGALSLGGSSLGTGTYRPMPSPTWDEIVSSPRFEEAYNRPGAIGWVLKQPDGSVIDLPAVQVAYEWNGGSVLGLKEAFEPTQHAPQLLLYLENGVPGLSKWYATIDVKGATLTTLPTGQRALLDPASVYLYNRHARRTDSSASLLQAG